MRKAKLIVFSLFQLLTSFIILAACIPSLTSTTEPLIESNLTAVANASAAEIVGSPVVSYATASSIEELVDQAEFIVIGRVEKSDEIINTARNPLDPTQSDPNLFGIGQVYKVYVDQYLKGDGSEFFSLIQNEGLITPEMPEAKQTIENARKQSDHIPLSSEKRYIFFLKYAWELTDTDQDYYVGILQPWRFEISGKNIARPESPWLYADKVFLEMPVVSFIDRVEQRVNKSN